MLNIVYLFFLVSNFILIITKQEGLYEYKSFTGLDKEFKNSSTISRSFTTFILHQDFKFYKETLMR